MRIVLAVDGSPSSVQARDLVASLPWPQRTEVTLVMAYEIASAWLVEGAVASGDWYTDLDAAMRRDADTTVARMAEALTDRGLSTPGCAVEGRAANAILKAADDLDADLIVVGSRGHGQIAAMLLGSVSAEVADRARMSVLVARGGGVARLLVATDGSGCSEQIPAVLGGWGIFRDLPAVALSVAPVASPAFELMAGLYTMGSEPLARQRDELLDQHRGYASKAAMRLSDEGIPSQAEVRTGDVANEITRRAAEVGADLIVTGSRCLHGVDRWLLGSVARNVLLHARASVLTVRPRGGTPAS